MERLKTPEEIISDSIVGTKVPIYTRSYEGRSGNEDRIVKEYSLEPFNTKLYLEKDNEFETIEGTIKDFKMKDQILLIKVPGREFYLSLKWEM